jgi:hypothetical protein
MQNLNNSNDSIVMHKYDSIAWQCDGWKNVARASVVATMATVEGEVSLIYVGELI